LRGWDWRGLLELPIIVVSFHFSLLLFARQHLNLLLQVDHALVLAIWVSPVGLWLASSFTLLQYQLMHPTPCKHGSAFWRQEQLQLYLRLTCRLADSRLQMGYYKLHSLHS
jgi:hypothetical protein